MLDRESQRLAMPSAFEILCWIDQPPAICPPTGVLMSLRAVKIQEAFSARNSQIFAALTRNIFDAFESGRPINQLCQDYGLPEQRVRDILKGEKARWRGLR